MKYSIDNPNILQHIFNVCRIVDATEHNDILYTFEMACDEQIDNDESYVTFEYTVEEPIRTTVRFSIPKGVVSEVGDYDPSVWNSYPFVVPDNKGWYRAMDGDYFSALYWNGHCFESVDGDEYSPDDFSNLLFKPWED